MTPEQFAYIQRVFLSLRSATEEERSQRLAEEEAIVRSEVRSLLASHEHCGTFLEHDPITPQGGPTLWAEAGQATSNLPRRIGNYQLLQLIGEGGHGSVFMAEQLTPIKRKVAVKLIKPGMDSKQVLARFDAEQQALAMMDHPSIARVIDADRTETGSPYFVMELVRGVPIHEFCDQNQLSLRERLELFLHVCHAVHHAHQKGVIHRDLKPSNVLVAMGEAEPHAKVIDFGIAKALDNRLTEQTLFTEYGQMIGTLEYMSPEQAEMSAVDIDTRSDVYSLGVLLYQLLTDETPISKEQLLKQGMFEIPRMIRETEPESPSARITSAHRPSTRTSAPKSTRIGELPSRDLDWVAMKALNKDRRRRYESALDFARDVERYLANEPVEAHPPSVVYKAGKLVQRYRAAAVTSSLVVSSLVLGVTGLVIGLQRAVKDRNAAVNAHQESERSKRQLAENLYSELLESGWRAAGRHDNARAHELLDACLPDLRGWEWQFAKGRIHERPHSVLRQIGEAAVANIATCSSGGQIACVLENGNVEVWNTQPLARKHVIDGVFNVNTAALSGDGLRLVLGSSNGELTVLRNNDWQRQSSRNLGLGGIYDISLSPQNRVAVCTGGGWIEVMQLDSLRSIAKWQLPTRVSSVTFLKEGKQLLAAGIDGHAYLLKIGEPGYSAAFVSEAALRGCQSLPDDHYAMMSAGRVLQINAHRLDDPPTEAVACRSGVTSMVTLDGTRVLAGCGDGSLTMRDRDGSSRSIASFGSAITALAVAENAQLLVALSDGRLLSVEVPTAQQDPAFAGSGTAISECLLLSKLGLGLTFDGNGVMQAIDLASGDLQFKKQAHSTAVWTAATDLDERILATVGEDQYLRCWELPDLQLRFEAPIDWGVRDVCVAPDGSWIAAAPPAAEAVGKQEGQIVIWDAKTGTPQSTLSGHQNWVLRMIASPDGNHLVSAGENRDTRIWNVATGESLAIISPPQRSPAEQLAFSPTGKTIYLGHRDGWVTSWKFPSAAPGPVWPAFGDALTGFAVVAEHRLVATSRSNATLRIYDFLTASNIAELDLGVGYISRFQLSQNRRLALIAGQERTTLIKVAESSSQK